MKHFLHAGAAVLLVWGLRAEAQFVDPSLRWRTLDTAHFSVHFAEHTLTQAQTVAEVAESVYPRVTGWLKWEPESRTQIVVLDSLDLSNGYASPLPFNFIGIILSPPDEGELLQNREWLELVLTHEFTHVVHLDKASRAPLVMRRIFGRAPPYFLLFFPNTLPNVWGPNWVKEGLAVYAESDWNKGWGRLGQSHFEGMMRAETARGPISLRELHAEGRGFPHNRDYLYGSYFFLFLGERYGPQAIVNYVENYSDNFFPYRMHSNTVAITGKPQDALWLEYEEWLRARFAAKAQDPGRRPDQGGEIIARAYSLTSPLLTRESERWYVQGDGYTLPKVMRQAAGGEVEPVLEIELMTRLWASPRGEVLLSKLEICRNYNYYYDLYRLVPKGDLHRLTDCGRFRFAAPLEDGRIVAIRVMNGEAEVLLLNSRGEPERSLYRAAPGEALTGLAARAETLTTTCCVGFIHTGRPLTDTDAAVVTGTIAEIMSEPVTVAVTVTVTVFASHTIGPVAVTVGVAVVKLSNATETICVPRTVITVPSAALTEIETAGSTETLTTPVTSALTETPGTIETICVPRIVITVPNAALTEIDIAGRTDTLTTPVTRAFTDTPGTMDTTWVPRMVMTVPKAAETEIDMAGIAEILTGPVTKALTETPGTIDTICVPSTVMTVPRAALTDVLWLIPVPRLTSSLDRSIPTTGWTCFSLIAKPERTHS